MAAHGREDVSDGGDGPVTQSPDTSPEIEARMLQAFRALTPAEKWHQVCEQILADDAHMLAGLRLRHPAADAHELRLRLAALKYDGDLVREAFGWDPALEGW